MIARILRGVAVVLLGLVLTGPALATQTFSLAFTSGAPAPATQNTNYPLAVAYTCSTSYYVNASTGSDSNTSTQAQNPSTPWLTISHAVLIASGVGGICIQVAPGTYAGPITLSTTAGAPYYAGSTNSTTGYVVLRCNQSPAASPTTGTNPTCFIANATSGAPASESVITSYASYWIVDGFDITETASTSGNTTECVSNSYASYPLYQPHHFGIFNSRIHDCGGGGLNIQNGLDDLYAQNNVIFSTASLNTSDESGISFCCFGVGGSSTTSLAIGTGTKTFTVASGLSFSSGNGLVIVNHASQADYMIGTVTSYSGTSLVTSITATGGSGTFAAWDINPGAVYTAGALDGTYGNYSWCTTLNGSGTCTATGGPTQIRNLITGNILHDNLETWTGSHSDGEGIIIDCQGTACGYRYLYGTLVAGNVSYHNGGNGIQVGRSDYVIVANNTTYNNMTDTQNTGTARAELWLNSGNFDTMINNIAVSAPGATGVTTNNNAIISTGVSDNYWFDNIAYDTAATTQGCGGGTSAGSGSVCYYSPDSVLSTANSYPTNPLFNNISTNDFGLQTGSPARNASGATITGLGGPTVGTPNIGDCYANNINCN